MFNLVDDGEENIITGISNTFNGIASIAIGISQTLYGLMKITKPYVIQAAEKAITFKPVIEKNAEIAVKVIMEKLEHRQLLIEYNDSSEDENYGFDLINADE